MKNAYFLENIGADTAENEQNFAKNWTACENLKEPLRSVINLDASLPRDGRSVKFRQNVARFRLYRHRSLQANTRFSAFFKIYQTI